MPRERALLASIVALFWASLYVFVPVLSPYAASLGAGLDLIGLVVGSYGVSQFLLRIPVGWLADRLGRRKPFIAVGFVVTVLSCLMMAWAPTAWYLVLGRGLSGVAATMWVPLSVLLAATFPPEQAVAAMGLANFATNIGQMMGTVSGGWLADRWGWGAPFLTSAAVAVGGLLLVLALRERPGENRGSISLPALGEVLTSRKLLMVAGFGALAQYMTYVTVFGFTPVYAAEALGATGGDLSWLTTATTIPSAVAALTVAPITKRIGVTRSLVGGFLVTAVTTLCIPFTGSLTALLVTQVVGGFGRGLVFPLLMGLSIESVEPSRRAMAMGAFQSIYAIGMVGGPVIAGAIGRFLSAQGLFVSTALVGLAAAVGIYLQGGKQHVAQG